MDQRRLGVMFDRARPPQELVGFAQGLERAGVDELWLVEDLGWGGSIAAAATALATTERITVGIGIVPAPFRNPALLAMELATLAGLHPGRLIAGIGHGVGDWMAQVGAAVASPLTLLEETMVGVRALLAGERVETHGRYVKLDGIQLVHPPATVPPLLAGVMKPNSLALSGRVADGTILVEGTGPDAIVVALGQIAAGPGHQLVVLTHLCVGDDPAAVEAAIAPVRRDYAQDQGVRPADIFVAAGPEDVVTQQLSSLWAAGADTVVLRPVGDDPLGMVLRILPAIGRP